jgi:hypothetical protein
MRRSAALANLSSFAILLPIMPQSLGRQLLEQLVGKTVIEVSHTDADEIAAKTDMSLYVFFTDGTVLKAGPNTFQIFKPGQYQG